MLSPKDAWDEVWNLDQTLRPWDELPIPMRRQWADWVKAGNYEKAKEKRESYD